MIEKNILQNDGKQREKNIMPEEYKSEYEIDKKYGKH